MKNPSLIEMFKEKYHIPQEVSLRYCSPKGLAFDREVGEVTIPMIAFIDGGMTLPMGRITRDYLRNHRLCPQQCTPNFFRILGAVDALNRHLGLGLTWHDLKSRSDAVRLISCLPKSNKWMKDDYLIASGPWHDGLPFVGYLRFTFSNIRFKLFVLGFALLYQKDFFFFTMNSKFLTV